MPRSDDGDAPPHAEWPRPAGGRAVVTLPLGDELRHRFVVLAAVLLGLALLCAQYAHRTPVYRAVALVDAPIASSYSDPGAPNGTFVGDQAAGAARAAHMLAEQQLLASAIFVAGDTVRAAPRVAGPFGHARVPRLALRSSHRSDILRVVVVASQPQEAVRLADAAANVLVRNEQRAWLAEIESSATTGRATQANDLNGASIAVISYARPLRWKSPYLRRLGAAVAVGAGVLCAACVVLLAADARVRIRTGAVGSGDLRVPVVATLRVNEPDTAAHDETADPSITVSVESELWQLLDNIEASRQEASPASPIIIAIGPTDDADYGSAPGPAQCRSAALHIARMAAARSRRVLLIAATTQTFSSPSSPADIPRLPGFAEAVSGRTIVSEWLLEDPDRPHLTGLSAGCVPLSSEQIGGESLRRFLRESAMPAEWLIIGAGPVFVGLGELSDLWAGAGAWADAVVLVNPSGNPDSRAVSSCACALLANGVPVVGQVTWLPLGPGKQLG